MSQPTARTELIVITTEQLTHLIIAAVQKGLEDIDGRPKQTLLDRVGIGQAFGISAGSVDKLRRLGLPHIRVGDSPRFEIEPCIAWLKQRGSNG